MQASTEGAPAAAARPKGKRSVVGSLMAGEVTAALEGYRAGGPIIETTAQRTKRLAAEDATTATDATATQATQEAPTATTPTVAKAEKKSKPKKSETKPAEAPAAEAVQQRPTPGSKRKGRSSVMGSLLSGQVGAALEGVAAGSPFVETSGQKARRVAAESEKAEEEAQAEAIEKVFASATPQKNGEAEKPQWFKAGSREKQEPTSPKKNGSPVTAATATAATGTKEVKNSDAATTLSKITTLFTPKKMQADPEALAAVLDANEAAGIKSAVKEAGVNEPNCIVLGFRWIVTCGKP